MNRVICDICGTTYMEAASQCPICGCAKSDDPQLVTDDTAALETAAAGGYTYVKGGRFSEKNVRKRNKERLKAMAIAREEEEEEEPLEEEGEEEDDIQDSGSGSNRGLIVVVILLLLAILASMAYLYVKYFAPERDPSEQTVPSTTQAALQTTAPTAGTTAATTVPPVSDFSCTGLSVSETAIELDSEGRAWLLNVKTEPANTTDVLKFYSSDSSVAAVTAAGLVTAVGPGEAMIIVECGEVVKEIPVSCTFQLPTEPTEPAFEPISGRINVEDRLRIRKEPSSDADIAGYYNANEMVQILETRDVNGTTWGRTDKGWISMDYVLTGEAAQKPPAQNTNVRYYVYINGSKPAYADGATFYTGDVFEITLVDSNGKEVDAYWSNESPSICKITNGMTCTAGKAGSTILRTTYNGKEYTYVIRVKAR